MIQTMRVEPDECVYVLIPKKIRSSIIAARRFNG